MCKELLWIYRGSVVKICRDILQRYRALLRRYRALLWRYRALLWMHRALLCIYRVIMLTLVRRGFLSFPDTLQKIDCVFPKEPYIFTQNYGRIKIHECLHRS